MILYASLLVLAILLPSTKAIEIKLKPGETLEEVQTMYPDAQISPLFTLPRERLIELSSVEEGLPDLTLWYSLTLPIEPLVEQSEEEIAASLESLDSISNVEIPKNYVPPNIGARHNIRHLAVTGNFEPNQGYLRMNTPTNNGIDAEYSWTFPGGDGEGVTIYDIEYSWNQQHEDLEVVRDVKLLLNEGDELPDNPQDTDHGTAVLGELVGTSNTFGIKGISHGAKAGMAPESTKNLGSNRANAIMLAVNDGKAGDIILLEMQAIVCGNPFPKDSQDGYGPAEEDQSVFDVTQVATANGITVVAAAGNGKVDLDSGNCEGKYDRNARDSGAVIVGAGGTGIKCPETWNGAPREKLAYSTFGSRVDIHGWGECIWTTGRGNGYKDPDNLDDQNKWYTPSFSGTSGASPMVAGAAANIQGIAMKKFGAPLKPAQLRQLLTDTGLPQLGDTSKKIGPLVNLRAAIDSLLATMSPTATPTASPTSSPTMSPSTKPTAIPTNVPTTISPTSRPTSIPTSPPTKNSPTLKPTNPVTNPTATPTAFQISSKSGKASGMPVLSVKSGKVGKSQKANKTFEELI